MDREAVHDGPYVANRILRCWQVREQLGRIGHFAADRVAHAHGDRRRGRAALGHDVEVVIEGRHLEHLGLREVQMLGERCEHGRRQMTLGVLDAVQALDQLIAGSGP